MCRTLNIQDWIKLVNPSTILPDFSIGASERTNVSHLDHGGGEIRGEGARVGAVATHNGVGGPTVEQLLIRVEETLLLNEVLEVVVVKAGWSLKIKWCQIVVPWPWCSRAALLPSPCKCGFYVGLVVDAGSEVCAPCLSNCVTT